MPQLVVGAGLFVAVVELAVNLEGLLVVRLRLRPLPLRLGHHAQLVVGTGL